ncbi:MAG TPA: DUF4214 domain-containing protein [Candidatus Dormibacteraeota bacterium]|nr:DUF4214 domain-containing protein [Candidatus Dormibacteraeota bacterium]
MRTQPRLGTAVAVVALIAGSFALALVGQWGRAGAATGGGATISVQTMDSCHQIKGQADYALSGGGVSMSATTPAGAGTAGGSGCPVPTGSCSAGPCAVFSGVPDGTYRIVTTKTPPPNSSNPEGYAPCEGGSACRSQVADLTVSGGSVSATVTNVYPDQKVTTFHFSGTSGDPIVFHDFGLAAPGSNGAQCDGDSDADDHSTGSPSGDCAFTPESAEASACQPFPWSCGLGSGGPGSAPPPAGRRLAVTVPSSVSAFTSTPVTVSAMNGTAVDPTFTGTVTLSDTGDSLAALPAAYTFTSADNGVHVFDVTFHRTGAMTLTASLKGKSGGTGGSDQLTVANDDASFVEDLYHDILGRLGSDSEVTYWAGQLAHGEPREAVAAFFSTSQEVYGRDIDADYQLLIGHAADPAGRAYWVGALSGGAYDETILAELASTSTYYSGHGGGTDKGFVTALYKDLLGRAPAAAELNGWLAGGPITDRAAVAGGFALSHEHHYDVVASPTGWYRLYLGRAADAGGAEYWATQLDQGVHDEVGVATFTSCAEYYGKPVAY